MNRGVYFLSNDRMYDITIAFLNSFRKYNPTISLCLIPFNNEASLIKSLKRNYNFTVFDNETLLKQCDDISVLFHGNVCGAYRKMALWEGTFDEFVYIDVDTIVLENIDFTFHHLHQFGCLTSHSNIPGIVQFVWKNGIYKSGHLTDEQINFAANTGFIVSTKRFMTFDWMKNNTAGALKIKNFMTLMCQEQPFLNYLMVTNGKPISSLRSINMEGKYNNIKEECWAGTQGAIVSNGRIYFKGNTSVLLVHWAGLWQPNLLDRWYNKLLVFLRLGSKVRKMNSKMPYNELWKYYRDLKYVQAKVIVQATD